MAINDTPTEPDDAVQNRSEIAFLYDGEDVNPNGNPQSTHNAPRIDYDTQKAIITDVRLKRYLRDQLDDDGHTIFIRNTRDEDGDAPTREQLLEASLEDIDGPEDVGPEILTDLLDNVVDIRMFGATLAIDTNNDSIAAAVTETVPNPHLKGPIQFDPARSMNAVVENEESNTLSSVIGTKEDKSQGGFGLGDHRIKYGLFNFHGIVDENGATDTRLTQRDVELLDTLCWRAIKNQTLSRSKFGQEPRLYVRVEYAEDNYHIGDLDQFLQIDEDHSEPDHLMRTINDVTVDVSLLVDTLERNADLIDTVHIAVSDLLQVSYDGEAGTRDLLFEKLTDALGSESLHEIRPALDYRETLPESE